MEETKKTLAELKAADLPTCDFDEFVNWTIDPGTPEETAAAEAELALLREAMSGYLKAFLPRSKTCVRCDSVLVGFLMGTFTWGLTNGEGFCRVCKYPARAYHRVRYGEDGKANFTAILQYHPSGLSEKKPDVNEATAGGR